MFINQNNIFTPIPEQALSKQGCKIFNARLVRGFTLMELLVTMGITVVLGGVAMSNYLNYKASSILDGAATELLGTLRDAQQRSVSQDQQSAWGVYINAVANDNDYYELFSGNSYASGTVVSRANLPSGLKFLLPPQGSTMEIDFAKSTGLPNAAALITIASVSDSSLAKTINVNGTTGLISSAAGLATAPTIVSINPYAGWNIAPVQISNLAGTAFQSGATVKFTKTGQSDIVCTGVTFVSAEKLTATCDITNASAGDWTVVVTNPDEQVATLSSPGFLISHPGGNTSGFAWSENIGWISFNCNDSNSCAQVEYGVSVDSGTGLFSGFAWSENIGWISFNTSDLAGCPFGTCEARLTGSVYPKTVTGWAKVISTGSWISMSSTTAPVYGVSMAGDGSFSGYSWDSDTIGWISWSGTNPTYGVVTTW